MPGSFSHAQQLQFGHDAEVVENVRTRSGSFQGVVASIRPRRRGRGEPPRRPAYSRPGPCFNSATTQRSWRTAIMGIDLDTSCKASIRPRRRGRGERPAGRPSRRRSSGRFNSATTQRSWRTRPGTSSSSGRRPLQFGHDAEVVENAKWAADARDGSRGFNSATTQRSWRTPTARPAWPGRCSLQFGHDAEVVENPARRKVSGTPGRLQFGHDAEVVENLPGPIDREGLLQLQFGHDAEVVENVAVHERADRHPEASIRPRRRGRGELSYFPLQVLQA